MNKKNWNRGIPMIFLGIVGILVSISYDHIGFGNPGFGILELSGLIIGAIMTTAGLVKVLFPDPLLLLRLLAGIYITGTLYFGLKPDPGNYSRVKVLMDTSHFCWDDAAINTLGFIPLGFLLILSFGNRQKAQGANLIKRAIIVAGIGVLISLFLETSQYYLIPGRLSSVFDWIFNSLGNLAGIALYIVFDEWKTLRTNGLRRGSTPPDEGDHAEAQGDTLISTLKE